MSVRTTADEKLDHVRELLAEAQKELLIVLNEDTYGHSEYKSEFIDELYTISSELLKLRRKL